jgi:hypothetical protein
MWIQLLPNPTLEAKIADAAQAEAVTDGYSRAHLQQWPGLLVILSNLNK